MVQLTEQCNVCGSTRWCGRPCKSAPKAETTTPVLRAGKTVPKSKPKVLADAKTVKPRRAAKQAEFVVDAPRRPPRELDDRERPKSRGEYPATDARREYMKAYMARRRAEKAKSDG